MQIINLSDAESPVISGRYPLDSPGGLAVGSGILYIVEGSSGIRILDTNNTAAIQDLGLLSDVSFIDVILNGSELYALSQEG